MTLTTRDYSAMRPAFVHSDNAMDISNHTFAIFWQGHDAVRLLLYTRGCLHWTERCADRREAIDRALEVAKEWGLP